MSNIAIRLEPEDARYLEQLNMELLYAQKAYMQALAHVRRRYNAPDGAWVLNNIEIGFEQMTENQVATNG